MKIKRKQTRETQKKGLIKILLMSNCRLYRRVDNNVADYHEIQSPPEIDYLEYTSVLIEPVSQHPSKPRWKYKFHAIIEIN